MSFPKLAITSAVLASVIPSILAHNFLGCVNSQPNATQFSHALTGIVPTFYNNTCMGFQRAAPLDDQAYFKHTYGDQGYPWQGIWPVMCVKTSGPLNQGRIEG